MFEHRLPAASILLLPGISMAAPKGMEENYAWLGQHWPDSRYVVISLSFDMQGDEEKAPWIEGWHCVYDTKMEHFRSLPTSRRTTRRRSRLDSPEAA